MKLGVLTQPTNDQVEVPTIMRALDPEVGDTVWAAIAALVPPPDRTHPLGCHRLRASDRDCFDGMLVRLATGCSWEDAERLCGHKVSDTTMRARRDEWIAAGVFDALVAEALSAYDKIIGLDLSDVSVDGSLHKHPAGGEGTGPNPTDRGKLGWKWSILTDLDGIPFGVAIDGANRNDLVMLAPTLDDADAKGLLADIETIWLDRGYDSDVTRERLIERNIDDAVIAKRRKRGVTAPKKNQPMGLRWPVERTNSWLSNFGQLRRNTDRKTIHRLAQLSLAVVFLLTAKLIDWRNRWSPAPSPIR
ncbi:MAG: IS5 family transposase [Acidimicrobiales bacterium]